MKKCLLAASLLAVTMWSPCSRVPRRRVFNDEQEQAIESIVRSYLLANPELLEEVIEELRKKREAEAAVRAAGVSPRLVQAGFEIRALQHGRWRCRR